MNRISIVELPFNLGLRAQDGREPGVHKLPDWLKKHHFHALLSPAAVHRLEAPAYRMESDPVQGVLNTDIIVDYARKQADLISTVLSEGRFPLVIGGDCSIIIGSTLALKRRGRYALFYLDGHTDFVYPQYSGTKAVAGMGAAIVAGIGHEKLINIEEQGPYIEEGHVWCVGNREYDDAYEDIVRQSKATYVRQDELRERSIPAVVEAFLSMIDKEQLDGFWLHIDVDILNDELMPAVDSRTAGGLSYEEFDQLLEALLKSPKIAGLNITILDPDLDPAGQYTPAFVQHFTETFNQSL